MPLPLAHHVILVAASLSLLLSCAPERPSDKQLSSSASRDRAASEREADRRPVATIEGEVITVADFEQRLNGMASYARARYSSVEKRQELLDSLIAFELLAKEAEEKGYGDDPAVRFALKDTMVRRMLDDRLRQEVSLADISPAEVERLYRERQGDKVRGPQRRAALITIEDEGAIKLVHEELQAALDSPVEERIKAFRRAAHRYHAEADVAARGGDLGFLDPPDRVKEGDRVEISRRVFELEQIGDFTAPYRHDNAWHMVLLLDEKQPPSRPLEQVTEELRRHLYEKRRHEAREAIIAELKRGKTITIDKEVLKSVPQPPSDTSLGDITRTGPATRDLRRTIEPVSP